MGYALDVGVGIKEIASCAAHALLGIGVGAGKAGVFAIGCAGHFEDVMAGDVVAWEAADADSGQGALVAVEGADLAVIGDGV